MIIENPSLRFDHSDGNTFQNWERKTLGDLCKITTGKLDANAASDDGAYRFYTCAKGYLLIDTHAFDTEALLISGNGANVGYIHYYKGKFNAYQRTYVLDAFTENINFIQFQLETKLRKRIQLESKAGNIPYIVMDTLAGMRLSFPPIPEQRKIAEFLTAVDGRIAQLERKKALLEDYKKGVMQQLFTQAIRFKDDHGKDFPEWEEKKLGEVSTKVGSGKTPRGGEQVYQASGIKFIRSQNVSANRLDLTNLTFISEEVNAEMLGSVVQPLDVLLNITGASIGRACVVPTDFDTGNVNQHVCIIRPEKKRLNPSFLQLFLASAFGQKLIEQGQTGSGREGLNFHSIRGFALNLPTLPEQTKIADFLTALDRKITGVGRQIAGSKDFKRGLLQQMFV